MQKLAKKSPSGHHRTILSGYIFATKARIENRGPLAAEISFVIWGTPPNVNGFRFRILAALLHGTLVVGISQTLWR